MQCARTVLRRTACVVTCRTAVAAERQWSSFFLKPPAVSQRHFKTACVALAYPTHKVVPMPALSPTMTQGTVSKWLKKEGDEVMAGDILAEIETDKASMEFEMGDNGYLAKILVAEGTEGVAIGQPLCVMVDDQSCVASFADYQAATPTATPSAQPPAPLASASQAPAPPAQEQLCQGNGKGLGSPAAKRVAREKGYNLSDIRGTGPEGRVLENDVYAYEKAGGKAPVGVQRSATPAEVTATRGMEVGGSAQTWAARLLEAKQNVPHYYLTTEIKLDAILRLNQELETEEEPVGLTAWLLKACAMASVAVPACNSTWMGTSIRQYNSVDVMLVMAAEGSPVTPVIVAADTQGLRSLSRALKAAAGQTKARNPTLGAQAGTIAVHASGIDQPALLNAAAIVMPPHACALTLGHPVTRVVPGPDGKASTALVMQATLSCDHRVVDGAVGAEWAKVFKGLCETPTRMLL